MVDRGRRYPFKIWRSLAPLGMRDTALSLGLWQCQAQLSSPGRGQVLKAAPKIIINIQPSSMTVQTGHTGSTNFIILSWLLPLVLMSYPSLFLIHYMLNSTYSSKRACYQVLLGSKWFNVESACRVKCGTAGGVNPLSAPRGLLHLLPSSTDRWWLPYNHTLPILLRLFVVNRYFHEALCKQHSCASFGYPWEVARVTHTHTQCPLLWNVRSLMEGRGWHCLTHLGSRLDVNPTRAN